MIIKTQEFIEKLNERKLPSKIVMIIADKISQETEKIFSLLEEKEHLDLMLFVEDDCIGVTMLDVTEAHQKENIYYCNAFSVIKQLSH